MLAEIAVLETSELHTLEQVYRWATRRAERLMPGEVVIQDEYSHDILFVAGDGSALAFDAS